MTSLFKFKGLLWVPPLRSGRQAIWILSFLFLLLSSLTHAEEPNLSYKDGDIISADTTWTGRVEVGGIIVIPEGVTLTIEPGTTVLFKEIKKGEAFYKEQGEDEVLIPGSGIRVEGKIIAVGARAKPVIFTSDSPKPAPGDWGCIFLDHSKGSIFKYCAFEYSAYTIHAHFSQFDVSRSTIAHNEDGSRLGLTRASYDHCDIRDNTGKGLNFRQSKVSVSWCNITGNQDGIFLNEKDAACSIENDNIQGNKMDLRLGDFHSEDVSLKGDWWGTADLKEIAGMVWDKEDDPEIGRAVIEPAGRHIAGAGVNGPVFEVAWKFKTEGFVDCNPAIDNGVVYFGSWDKKFYAVKEDTGELLWSFHTGDCVDSSPAVADGKVYFGSWDRNIYCLDAKDGKLVWKFEMPPSNFDDHRQASPAVDESKVFIGGFNGCLYILGAKDGKEYKKLETNGPIRAKPLITLFSPLYKEEVGNISREIHVYLGSNDGNMYSFEINKKLPLWSFKTGGAVNSYPINDELYLKNADKTLFMYFGSQDGKLYSVNRHTGKFRWSYYTGSRIEYSSPLNVINNDLVLIGDCSGTLHAVDRDTGQAVWKFTGGGGIYSSPQASGEYVVYGDNAGNVYALDPDGSLMSQFKAGADVQGLSVGPDGAVYAGSRDGYLYKLMLGE